MVQPSRGHWPRRVLSACAGLLAVSLSLASAPSASATEPAAQLASAPGAAAAAPLNGPYLQAGTPTGMTVMWQGAQAAPGRVSFKDAAGRVIADVPAGSAREHQARIERLTPGTRYRYEVLEHGRVVATGAFRTNPGPATTRFRFAAIGDTGSGNANQQAVAERLLAWKPDFVVHTGDVVYERGEADDYPARFFKPYAPLIDHAVMYLSAGNHDYGTGHAKAYLDVVDAPRPRPDAPEQWYTFRYGNAQFFALDSNLPFDKGTPQYAWLQAQLAASDAPWKFAFFHHPPYSSGAHGSSPYLRQAWGPLFERYDVQLVFTGHDHHYERISPREDFVKDGRPTTYVVTGGGGAWLRRVNPQAFTVSSGSFYHFIGLEMDGDTLTAQTIDKDGRIADRWTITR